MKRASDLPIGLLSPSARTADDSLHFNLAVQACRDLDCLNARHRRCFRARNWASVQSYLETEIHKQSLYSKKAAAALGRLVWELQIEWETMETAEYSMIERQNIRLMLLLFIAVKLDSESKTQPGI
jgi:hypothetical protein